MQSISLDDIRSGDRIKFKYQFRDGRIDIVSTTFISYCSRNTQIQCINSNKLGYQYFYVNSIIEILEWKATN